MVQHSVSSVAGCAPSGGFSGFGCSSETFSKGCGDGDQDATGLTGADDRSGTPGYQKPCVEQIRPAFSGPALEPWPLSCATGVIPLAGVTASDAS